MPSSSTLAWSSSGLWRQIPETMLTRGNDYQSTKRALGRPSSRLRASASRRSGLGLFTRIGTAATDGAIGAGWTGLTGPKVTHRGNVQGNSPGCLSAYQSPLQVEVGFSGGPHHG
jgi:hypothetical protein